VPTSAGRPVFAQPELVRIKILLAVLAGFYALRILLLTRSLRHGTAGPNAFVSLEKPHQALKSLTAEMASTVGAEFRGAYLEDPTIFYDGWASHIFLYKHPTKELYLWFRLLAQATDQRVAILRRSGDTVEELPRQGEPWPEAWQGAADQMPDEAENLETSEFVELVGQFMQSKAAKMTSCFTVLNAKRWKLPWATAIRQAIKCQGVKEPKVLRYEGDGLTVTTRSPLGEPDDDNIGYFFQNDQVSANLDLLVYERAQEKKATPKSWWWLPLSFIAFVVSFSFLMDFDTALILAGVIFLHEIGHWLAMRFFGYQNTRFFFLPFFGGAAVGRKKHPKLHQVILVLLAGPIPGVVLAVVLTALWNPDIQTGAGLAVLMLWFINALNLLPIVPLDGGRVVETLLFSKKPWAEMAFRAGAIALLGWAAWNSVDSILVVLVFILLVGTPHAWKLTNISEAIRNRSPQGQAPDILVAEEILRRYPAGVHSQSIRTTTLGQVFPKVSSSPGSWGASLAWLAVYLFCLAFALVSLPLTNYLAMPHQLLEEVEVRHRALTEYKQEMAGEKNGWEVLEQWFEQGRAPDDVNDQILSVFEGAHNPLGMQVALEFSEFTDRWERARISRDLVREALSKPAFFPNQPMSPLVFRDVERLAQCMILYDLEQGNPSDGLELLGSLYSMPREKLVDESFLRACVGSLKDSRELLLQVLSHYQLEPAQYESLLRMQRSSRLTLDEALAYLDFATRNYQETMGYGESSNLIIWGELRRQFAAFQRVRETLKKDWPRFSYGEERPVYGGGMDLLPEIHDLEVAGLLITEIKLLQSQSGQLPSSLQQLETEVEPDRWSYEVKGDQFELHLGEELFYPYPSDETVDGFRELYKYYLEYEIQPDGSEDREAKVE
jgi:Zn-dependent protease